MIDFLAKADKRIALGCTFGARIHLTAANLAND